MESRWMNIERVDPEPSLFWISFVHVNSACKEYKLKMLILWSWFLLIL
jgi:hypothetical protein